MELKDYLGILKRRIIWFLLVFIVFVAAHVLWVFRESPPYSARAQVVLTSSDVRESFLEDLPIYNMPVSLQISVPTRQALVKTKRCLDIAHRKLLSLNAEKYSKLFQKPSELRGAFTSQTEADTEIFNIVAQHKDPEVARDIANSVAMAYKEFSQEFGKQKLEEAIAVMREQQGYAEEEIENAKKALQEGYQGRDMEVQEAELTAKIQSLEDRKTNLMGQIQEIESSIRLKLWEKNWTGSATGKYEEIAVENIAAIRQIRQAIREQKMKIRRLQVNYTDDHPAIVEARAEMTFLEDLVESEKARALDQLDNTLDKEILRQKLNRDYLQGDIEGLDDDIAALKKQRDAISSEVIEYRQKKARLERANTTHEKILVSINTLQLRSDVESGDVRNLTKATDDDVKQLSRPGMNAIPFVMVLGALAGLGCVYLMEYMDTRIRTEHDIRRHLNLPVLGRIPKVEGGILLTELSPTDPISELFNTSATLIHSMAQDMGLKSFLVCSTREQEGKSTISVNLAIALARKGKNVILVDTDLRIPTLHEFIGVQNRFGVSSILEGRLEAKQALSDLAGDAEEGSASLEGVLFPTPVPNLKVLPSGPAPADPVALLESSKMRQLVEDLKRISDIVIFDTPPIYNVGDTLIISQMVDAHLFIVGANEPEQHEVTWAKHLLNNVDANILGVFLNKTIREGKEYYYYYYDRKSHRVRQ